jgi:lactoylglutathione lyase
LQYWGNYLCKSGEFYFAILGNFILQQTCKGEYIEEFDNLVAMAEAENTHKFVLNFWAENLEKEREKIVQLSISDKLTKIKYINNVKPYYYFQLTDPDGNIIEITGQYSPKKGEFDE